MKKGLLIVLSFGVLFLGYWFFDSLIKRNENYPDVGLEQEDLKEEKNENRKKWTRIYSYACR